MAYLKSLAVSLKDRVLPEVASSLFLEENNKLTSFKEKLDSAREITTKATQDVRSTFGPLTNIGPISRTMANQLRTGNFGRSQEEIDNAFFGGGGDDMGGGGLDLSALDAAFGDAGGDDGGANDLPTGDLSEDASGGVTVNKTVENTLNVNGFAPNTVTEGDALLNERMMHSEAVSSSLSRNQIGLLARIANDQSLSLQFMQENVKSFQDTVVDFIRLSSESAEQRDQLEKAALNYYTTINKRNATKATTEDEMLLDPERIAKKIFDGQFDMLFGDNSIFKSVITGFVTDPIGALAGLGINTAIGSLFGQQIEGIKTFTSTLDDRLESFLTQQTMSQNSFVRSIANFLLPSRANSTSVSLGSYTQGEVPFDGKTRKAIVDVIPMYLSKILKAVSNAGGYEVYDYQKGAFLSDHTAVRNVQKDLAKIDRGEGSASSIGRQLQMNMVGEGKYDRAQITAVKRMVTAAARSSNSHEFNSVSEVDFGSTDANAKFRAVWRSLDNVSKRDIEKSFHALKRERVQQLQKLYTSNVQSDAGEHASILMGKSLGIRGDSLSIANRNERTLEENMRGLRKSDAAKGEYVVDASGIARRVKNAGLNLGERLSGGTGSDTVRATENVNPFDKDGKLIGKMSFNNDSNDDGIAAFFASLQAKFVDPLKKFIVGKDGAANGDDSSKMSLRESIMSRFQLSIINPLKGALLGKDKNDESVKNTSFLAAVGERMDTSVIIPFKRLLLGDQDNERAATTSLWSAINQRMEASIFLPVKRLLLGDQDNERAATTTLWSAINQRLDASVFLPVKRLLLGKDKNAEAESTSLWSAITQRMDTSVFNPFKRLLLGADPNADVSDSTLWAAAKKRFDMSIMSPVKRFLGGDGAEDQSLGTLIKLSFTDKILNPMKVMLMGRKEGVSAQDAMNTPFFTAMKEGFSSYIVKPINKYLFGAENGDKGFFSNMGAHFAPFFNKMVFGEDAASKAGFIDNLTTKGKELWTNVWAGAKDNFFTPLGDAVKDFFGPTFKEFRNVLGSEIKHFGKTIFSSISESISSSGKGLFKTILGDQTANMLHEKLVKPLRSLVDKLTEGMSKAFKFLFRIPVNFLKGITNVVKAGQAKAGRGNYSDEERKRLSDMEKSGRFFNFFDMGDPTKKSEKGGANGEKKESFADKMRRVFSGAASRVGGAATATAGAVASGVSNVATATANIAGAGVKSTAEVVQSTSTAIGNKIGDLTEVARSIATRIGAGAKSIADKATGNKGAFASKLSGAEGADSASAANRVIASDLPKISSNSGKILTFMQKNMTSLDNRLENVVRLLRDGGRASGDGSTKIGFFRNPLVWMAQFTSGILGQLGTLGTRITGAAFRIVNSIISIPGKIIKPLAEGAVAITRTLATSISVAVQSAGKVLDGAMKFVGRIAVGLGDAAGKLLSSLTGAVASLVSTAVEMFSSIAKPLAKGIGEVVGALAKNVGPAVDALSKGLLSAGKMIFSFVGELAKRAGQAGLAVLDAGGRFIGRGLGLRSAFTNSATSSVITNFKELFKLSRMTPMNVFVVGGKVGTYKAPERRGTIFKDKVEDRSWLDRFTKGKDGKKDEKGPLGKLLSGIGNLLGGGKGLAGGALTAGGSLLGRLLGRKAVTTGGVVAAKEGAKAAATKPGILSRLLGRGAVVPAEGAKAAATKPGILSRLLGRGAVVPAEGAKSGATKAVGRGALNVAGKAAGASKLGMLGRFGGRLVKGAGVAGLVSAGGGLAADLLFDQGGAAHGITSKAANYAGVGGLIGSVIPVVGTAVGTVVGAVVGALVEAVPRFIKWVETKFEKEIQSATDTLIEFPQRLANWANELPERVSAIVENLPETITSFVSSLPEKITSFFISDDLDSDGNESKPSLLGRMFKAFGQAGLAIVVAIPKIFIGIGEGILKGITTATISGVALLGKSVYKAFTSVADSAERTFDTIIVKAQTYLPSFMGGLSDAEAKTKMQEIDAKYLKRSSERASELGGFDDSAKSLAKMASNWSFNAGKVDGSTGITKYRDAYNESLASADGDKERALELFKERTKNELDAKSALAEFQNQTREKAYKDDKSLQEFKVNGFTQNKGASGTQVNVSGNYKSDPGLFKTSDVDAAIKAASAKYGIPENVLNGIAEIESNKRYWVTNSAGYMGLFQMGKNEFAQFAPNPSGNPLDPYQNAMAGANYLAYHASGLAKMGIPASAENLYLAHQQGLSGFGELWNSAKNGTPLSSARIRNMGTNPPSDGKGAATTASDFIGRWTAIVASKTGGSGSSSPVDTGTATANAAISGDGTPSAAATVSVDDKLKSKMLKSFSGSDFAAISQMTGAPTAPSATVSPATPVPPTASASITPASISAPIVTANVSDTPASVQASTERMVKVSQPIPTASESVAVRQMSVQEKLLMEAEAQTALLESIRNNTASGGTGNFFSGNSGTTTAAAEVAASPTNNTTNVNIRRNQLLSQNDSMILKPGLGAYAVAKGGSRVT